MASSSSSSISQVKYDVFLSFRGEDTRYSFASHLYKALDRESVKTFIDDKLVRGEEISPSLVNAIKESFISVIIFSEGYASSRWCLQELVEILKCRKKYNQVVIPVFYRVDPSDMRNLRGSFGEEFGLLEERFSKSVKMLRKWRNALKEVASLSGFDSKVIRNESALVDEIVDKISKKLNRMPLNDYGDLVGVESSINRIESLLHIGSNDVCIIGIWGMGGIGKTTIAKAVFNKIWSHFEESYFAENVSKESKLPNGLTRLQEGLLSKNSNTSFAMAKLRLDRIKVLLVLDDVTSANQNIYEDLNYLGEGSRVIITARDKQVLQHYKVADDKIYKVEGLFYNEAFQLFGRHAFPQGYPISLDYYQLSDKVLEYAKGVPLALKELGRTLSGKPKEFWESAINRLQKIPNQVVQQVLEASYEELDESQQNAFLDMACFFKWENIDLVEIILKANDYEPNYEIRTLVEKCLITIANNKITMHDLLQEMGWQIVRKGKKTPEKRNRLWCHEDIHLVLTKNKGTEAIEGICLDMSIAKDIDLNPGAFTKMQNLKILKVFNSHCEENNINKVHVSQLESDFTELRYLCWHGCPLTSLENFHPLNNLVVLDMPYSNIEQLWTGVEHLVNLRHINLSYSKHLRRIQDLSWVPNLENLILEGCTSLHDISSSIEHLDKLVILNLRECKRLCSLPTGIRSSSLRKVIFSGCSNLEMLPEMSSNVEELFLDETSIETLTPSIGILSKLVILNLKNCSRLKVLPSNICELKSLEHLNLSGCSKLDGLPDNLGNFEALKVLKVDRVAKRVVPSSIVNLSFLMELHLTACCIKELPSSLGQLSSLESLLLGGNNFESIPTSIKDLSKLCYLDIGCCERLQSLPKLPCHLQYIDAHNCTLLEVLSDLSFLFSPTISRKGRINFINCFNLDQNALKDTVKDTLLKIQRLEDYKEFYQRPSACVCYPGTEIPEWFTYNSPGSSISLDLEPGWFNSNFVTFAMCTIVEFGDYSDDKGQGLVVSCDCKLRSKDDKLLSFHGTLRGSYFYTKLDSVNSEHIFLGYDFNMCSYDEDKYGDFHCNNQMTIEFYVNNLNAELIDSCKVIKCGVHLLYFQVTRNPVTVTIEEEDEPELGFLKEVFYPGNQFKGESSESTVRSPKYVKRRKKGIDQIKTYLCCLKVNPAPGLDLECQQL